MTNAASQLDTSPADGPGQPDSPDEAIAAAVAAGKLLVEPYRQWVARQPVPVIEELSASGLTCAMPPVASRRSRS